MTFIARILLLAALAWPGMPALGAPAARLTGPVQVSVDASNVGQGIFMVHQRLPLQPGPVRLLYPKWLPGWHGPWGRPEQIAGLVVRVGGQRLPWRRAQDDPWAFDVEVPAGANALELNYQWLGQATGAPGWMPTTREQLGISWPTLLLYPAGPAQADVSVSARVRLPRGWGWGSALRAAAQTDGAQDGWVNFAPENLEVLMDSPVWAGAHYRRIELDPPGAAQPAALHLFSGGQAKAPTDAQVAAHRRLIEQAERLFGWRPWRHYDALLAPAEGQSPSALEHHESAEVLTTDHYFDDWTAASRGRDLLPHELVHAWNGKAYRPADLWSADMNTPTQNSLLWVYEGLTQYWGEVLAVRAGLVSPEQMQRRLARTAAYLADLPGREWRSLQDTTMDPQLTVTSSSWPDWTRSYDYYAEAALMIWLDADTLIRERSGGARSLDDFARAFFRPQAPGAAVVRYRFEDVVDALQRVQPYDWAGFLGERLERTGSTVSSDGLARAGWSVGWAEQRSALDLAELDLEKPELSLYYSLGLDLAADGQVQQLRWAGPAFVAGVSNKDVVVAVNGLAYKPDLLEAALRGNRNGQSPPELLLRRGAHYRTLQIDVRTGPRHPRAERLEGVPDRLAAILAPR